MRRLTKPQYKKLVSKCAEYDTEESDDASSSDSSSSSDDEGESSGNKVKPVKPKKKPVQVP